MFGPMRFHRGRGYSHHCRNTNQPTVKKSKSDSHGGEGKWDAFSYWNEQQKINRLTEQTLDNHFISHVVWFGHMMQQKHDCSSGWCPSTDLCVFDRSRALLTLQGLMIGYVSPAVNFQNCDWRLFSLSDRSLFNRHCGFNFVLYARHVRLTM